MMVYPFSGESDAPSGLEKRTGYDVWLLALTLALCVAGAIFVLTASAAHSWRLYHGDSMAIFWNHVSRLGWGLVCLTVLAFVDYHYLERLARPLWIVSCIALVAVLFLPQPPGATAHRWIYFHGFSFQPAEMAKFALISYLALRFGGEKRDPFVQDRSKIYVGALLVTVLTLLLVVLEPNLSMAILTVGTASLLFFLSGVQLKPLAIIGGACALPLSLIAWLTPYMRVRLTAFVEGIADPFKASYHVRQSLIGIGQGGITGLGLGASTQKHFFLPEPFKDFIYSIVGEELGLWGAGLLLVGFVLFLARAWHITKKAPDGFGYYLSAGITCAIALSLVVNVGVTLGLLPATGQPLPFISYGGSSLMMTMGAVGVLLNISRQSQRSIGDPNQPILFL